MVKVHPKKYLGQHFLRDREIAYKVAMSLTGTGYSSVLEIGPGTGILTEFLLERNFPDFKVIEIDNESVHYLKGRFQGLEIITGDVLKMDLGSYFDGKLGIAGNFPYNISSQILFKALENKDKIAEVCGMFQKEVAERISSTPGTKKYGIMSVMVQAYYHTEYLFTVSENVFFPQPRVKSAVIRLKRNETAKLDCNEDLFLKVVKTAFNQRRKTLRNALKSLNVKLTEQTALLMDQRAEQLSVRDFVILTKSAE